MDRLWTPWRMEYVKDAGRNDACIFCDLPAKGEEHDAESLIVARAPLAFAILNKYPYNSGHLMVAAYRHCARYEELTVEEHAAVASLVSKGIEALRQAYRPEGFNIGVNQGRVAGAGIVDHLHMHVVPRWAGDTNYMTTVGDTKVLPQALDQTYELLRPLFPRGA